MPEFLLFGVIFFLGACLGSFSSALAHRWLEKADWISKRSSCPHCGHVLSPVDLVPVLSWLFLKGRCRYCRKEISFLYFFIELLSGLSSVYFFTKFGMGIPFFLVLVMLPALMALLLVDLKSYLLPDRFILVIALMGGAFHLSNVYHGQTEIRQIAQYLLINPLLYGGLLYAVGWGTATVLKKEALGFGDVKFAFAAGVWLPLAAIPAFYFLSGAAGVLFGLVWRRMTGNDYFPFGPALIAAFIILLGLPQDLEHWVVLTY